MTLTQHEKQSLVDLANTARQRAYVPYSKYRVGSSLRTKTGRYLTGVNVENAAYPQTMCAERVAIFKAVSEGEKEFRSDHGCHRQWRLALRRLPSGDGRVWVGYHCPHGRRDGSHCQRDDCQRITARSVYARSFGE